MQIVYDLESTNELNRVLIVDGDKVIPICNYKITIDEGGHETTFSRWGNKKVRKERQILFQNKLNERNSEKEISDENH